MSVYIGACMCVCAGEWLDNGVKLFRKHTLSTGSLNCSSCKCPQWFLSAQNGSSAGDKTASLYLGCIKDNAKQGVVATATIAVKLKMWRSCWRPRGNGYRGLWWDRAGGGEGGLLSCIRHSGSSRRYRWGGSMSVTLFSLFSLPVFPSALTSMSPVSLGPISIPRPT